MWDWASWAFLALGLLAAAAGVASLVQGWRFARYVHRSREAASGPLPPVVVLAPVRLADPGLAENLDALLRQDYPEYRVVFAVDSTEDPAVPVIEAAVARHGVPARIVVSGGPRGGSGKAAALACAAEELRPGDAVVVTYDADSRPHPWWLASLVGSLADGVGAATGYRWYAASGGIWSAVRSAWNASGYNVLTDDRYNFSWGGATAMRRAFFDEAGIRQRWPESLSDDLVVTLAVKARGLRVRFVPRAVCVSEEALDRRACIAWTTQQAAFVHAYYPRLTTYALGTYAVFDGAVILGVLGIVLGVVVAPEFLAGAGLFLLDLPFTAVKAEQRRRALARALPEWRGAFDAGRGRFLAASLVVPWLMLVNLWRVRNLREIAWRGRTYPLPRPRKGL